MKELHPQNEINASAERVWRLLTAGFISGRASTGNTPSNTSSGQ
jgi:hypothetical protein